MVGEPLERVGAWRVAAQVVVQAPRLRDRVEGRVGDRVAHLPAEHVVPLAVDLAPLDAAGARRGIEMAGERVERLVVVVVGVEHGVAELGDLHGDRG